MELTIGSVFLGKQKRDPNRGSTCSGGSGKLLKVTPRRNIFSSINDIKITEHPSAKKKLFLSYTSCFIRK